MASGHYTSGIGHYMARRAGLSTRLMGLLYSHIRTHRMKPFILNGILAASLIVTTAHAEKEVISYDTTSPNQFWFSSSEYVVTETSTNAVITITWQAGDRGYSGYLDYYTSDGTATAGSDYTPVSSRLFFSGPGPRTISVPISTDCATEGDETFKIIIVNSNAIITQSNAVVRITDGPCVPKLEMASAGSSAIAVSWPSDANGFVLERSDDFSSWEQVAANYVVTNGKHTVIANTANGVGFFRLKKTSP
jgi:hypothetical protein